MKTLGSYFIQFIARPLRVAERMAGDPDGVWAGFWCAFLFLLAYSLTVLIYYLLGHQPMAPGFLPISREKWYLVQTFTTIPIGLGGFISYAGLAHLLGKAWGGTGSFESTFGAQMFANVIPCALFIAPFFIAAGAKALPWPDWVDTLRVFVIPLPWIFALSVLSLSKTQRISWLKALLIVPVSWIPLAGIMAVFIR